MTAASERAMYETPSPCNADVIANRRGISSGSLSWSRVSRYRRLDVTPAGAVWSS